MLFFMTQTHLTTKIYFDDKHYQPVFHVDIDFKNNSLLHRGCVEINQWKQKWKNGCCIFYQFQRGLKYHTYIHKNINKVDKLKSLYHVSFFDIFLIMRLQSVNEWILPRVTLFLYYIIVPQLNKIIKRCIDSLKIIRANV